MLVGSICILVQVIVGLFFTFGDLLIIFNCCLVIVSAGYSLLISTSLKQRKVCYLVEK